MQILFAAPDLSISKVSEAVVLVNASNNNLEIVNIKD